MNVLITGAKGFVGKNLTEALKNIKDGKDRTHPGLQIGEIYLYDVDSAAEDLAKYCEKADFLFNLAGVNRPKDNSEFMSGNFGFASDLLNALKKCGNKCPVMLSSSVQASLSGRFADSEYGKSKLAGEELFFEYARETGVAVYVYRFPNLFGKWCRPNYNSAIATFCHNIANGLPIQVSNPAVEMDVLYIDDLVDEMLCALAGQPHRCEFDGTKPVESASGKYCYAPVHYETTLGYLAETISSFPKLREKLGVPDSSNGLESKLYSAWLSYLPASSFIYDLRMNEDERGSFTEIIRTKTAGQFSVNIIKPGVVKGNHWHHSKHEKFVVVSGEGLIQLRKIGTDEEGREYPIVEYRVSGKHIQVVDMIPGYAHCITNLSNSEDLVTFMWANECFDANRPETYSENVNSKGTGCYGKSQF
ncbi:MAG: NAD-dependent epimerase/dehydratase family protein [Firmicutes bacterium]|nr:NAD-dependent epimerase/dehydratase family protein [Bacillota bacterium]